MEDNDTVFVVCEDRNYNACPKCSVTYAKDRTGTAFLVDEDVMIKPGRHPKLDNRLMTIMGIYIFEECESGRMIWMKDKETEKPLKIILDTNWLNKVNKN